MKQQQHTLMKFCPATGNQKPYPSHASQWREYHGDSAWLFNPWTGQRRGTLNVGSDCFGHLIIPLGEPIYAPKCSKKEMIIEILAWRDIAIGLKDLMGDQLILTTPKQANLDV